MGHLSKLTFNYRLVQSLEEIIALFSEGNEQSCQLWTSSKKQLPCKIVRRGEKFFITLDQNFRTETVFYIHCPKMSFAMKFKTLSEEIKDEQKLLTASLIKWVRPEFRGLTRNKVTKTKAFVFFETSTEKKVISGEVRNFNFYGCQIQFHMQYEETLRRLDPTKIPIKIKSANEITYYGNLCYLITQNDNVFIGIHFPDGCSAKVLVDNWS